MKKRISTVRERSDYSVPEEVQRLKQQLDMLGVDTDPVFYDKIMTGDIIEVYAYPQLKQVYANAEFSKICSYTKEQMEKVPFTALFWRDETEQKKLLDRAIHVALREGKACPWDLDNHELVESLHPRKRTFEMEFNWIAPTFDKQTRKPVGWVCSIQVNLIYEWSEDVA